MPSFQDLARKTLEVLGLGQSGSAASGPPASPAMAVPGSGSESTSWLRFEGHGPQWGFAFWELSHTDLERLSSSAGKALSLRIADVTGLDPSQPAHAVQEMRVEPRAGQWGVALPLGNRIYRAELGFHGAAGWCLLACSSPTHISGYDSAAASPDAFVPFTAPAAVEAAAVAVPMMSATPGLHERLYQSATVRVRRLGHGSEEFLEVEDLEGGGIAFSDSGIGLWASGRNDSGIGLVARQRSFWLVADAELIVYGATEPTATLMIGDDVVPLAADGSFRIQVPFRDGQQLYPIVAISADGEQRRSITLQFERTTPEDHTNPASAAKAEWF